MLTMTQTPFYSRRHSMPKIRAAVLISLSSAIWRWSVIDSSQHTVPWPSRRTASHMAQTQYLTASFSDYSMGQPLSTHTHTQTEALKKSRYQGQRCWWGQGARKPSTALLVTCGAESHSPIFPHWPGQKWINLIYLAAPNKRVSIREHHRAIYWSQVRREVIRKQ